MTSLRTLRVAFGVAIIAIIAIPATALAAAPAQAASKTNLGWLLAGLIIVWGGFFAYTFYLSRKTRDMRRDLDELRNKLNK